MPNHQTTGIVWSTQHLYLRQYPYLYPGMQGGYQAGDKNKGPTGQYDYYKQVYEHAQQSLTPARLQGHHVLALGLRDPNANMQGFDEAATISAHPDSPSGSPCLLTTPLPSGGAGLGCTLLRAIL